MNDRPPSPSESRDGATVADTGSQPPRTPGSGHDRQAEDTTSVWASPLGRWLRGLIDDPSSLLPSLNSVMDAARREFDRSSTLGVLFVRFEDWGHTSRLYGWRDIQSVYEVASSVAVSLVGHGIRQLDLPADLGLVGEGFAVLLSGPRDSVDLEIETVDMVADRFADLVRERLSAEVDPGLVGRTTIDVGAALVRRPAAAETLEDSVVAGLVAAERGARLKHEARLVALGAQLQAALDGGVLSILFQPVAAIEFGNIVAFDAGLQGPAHSSLERGDVVLDVAHRTGKKLRVLDQYHHMVLRSAADALKGAEQLVLRVSAEELLESAVRLMSLLYHRETARVTSSNVLFLVDSEGLADHFPAVLPAWRSVGEMGFQTCVDLSPNRPLPLDYLSELRPDVLRVSGRLVRDVHRHQDEFEYLLMLSRFATRHDIRILAADCVDRREFTALRRAGVAYVQGEFVAPSFATLTRPQLTFP